MAIIDGKRWTGWEFFKVRGKREWLAYSGEDRMLYGLCAGIEERENPLEARFRYCSGTTQPVFLDGSHCGGYPLRPNGYLVRSSWKKMPEEWKAIFRRDVFSLLEGARV